MRCRYAQGQDPVVALGQLRHDRPSYGLMKMRGDDCWAVRSLLVEAPQARVFFDRRRILVVAGRVYFMIAGTEATLIAGKPAVVGGDDDVPPLHSVIGHGSPQEALG